MKIGLITFHASYNFGSVWQAFALQQLIQQRFCNCEIINYRMLSQKDKYSLFPLHYGLKSLLRSAVQLPYIFDKRKSYRKYEDFINRKMNLTQEINSVNQLNSYSNKYDLYIAGSDQIWGYGIPEYIMSNEDSRQPYFMNFTDKPKISYASSTGTATEEQLSDKKELLGKFSALAVRESRGKEIIERLTGRKVEVVLDPTYLVSHDEWRKIAEDVNLDCPKKYILIYSLQGMKKSKSWKRLIDEIVRISDCEFVAISPFAPIRGKRVKNMSKAGPEEILKLFSLADYIYTDTFHGMSFSIHLRQSFTLFEDKPADFRKRNILERFNLTNRETTSLSESVEMLNTRIDYSELEPLIEAEISHSLNYLNLAIENATRLF